jgi:sugar/nucleoside kinase (ribokinase family)
MGVFIYYLEFEMKKIKVYGIGNALVDLIVPISEELRSSLELEKGTMRLVSVDEQKDLIEKISNTQMKMVSGGSVANSIYAISQLGNTTALSCSIGDDKYGLFYKSEFEASDTIFAAAPSVGAATGTCLVCITPDGERTMRTCLAASSDFSWEHICQDTVAQSEWVFIEGYLLANPGKVLGWLQPLIDFCKKVNTKIAFTCSESWVIDNFRDAVDLVVENSSFIFANEQEACALSKKTSIQDAAEFLSKKFEYTCLTAGENGAYVSKDAKVLHVPAFKVEVKDLNGAGDACAAGFLSAILNGKSVTDAGKLGCYLASNVIQHTGARYPGSLKALVADVNC